MCWLVSLLFFPSFFTIERPESHSLFRPVDGHRKAHKPRSTCVALYVFNQQPLDHFWGPGCDKRKGAAREIGSGDACAAADIQQIKLSRSCFNNPRLQVSSAPPPTSIISHLLIRLGTWISWPPLLEKDLAAPLKALFSFSVISSSYSIDIMVDRNKTRCDRVLKLYCLPSTTPHTLKEQSKGSPHTSYNTPTVNEGGATAKIYIHNLCAPHISHVCHGRYTQ